MTLPREADGHIKDQTFIQTCALLCVFSAGHHSALSLDRASSNNKCVKFLEISVTRTQRGTLSHRGITHHGKCPGGFLAHLCSTCIVGAGRGRGADAEASAEQQCDGDR